MPRPAYRQKRRRHDWERREVSPQTGVSALRGRTIPETVHPHPFSSVVRAPPENPRPNSGEARFEWRFAHRGNAEGQNFPRRAAIRGASSTLNA
jgi:hypothetical protein